MTRRHLFTALLALVLPASALAQTGFPPFASIERTQFEARNDQNMNVNFTLPVGSSPGRGIDLNMSVVYNSLNWTPVAGGWTYNNQGPLGWLYSTPVGTITYQLSNHRNICLHSPDGNLYVYHTTYQNYQYVDAFGTRHALNLYWDEAISDCDGSDVVTATYTFHLTDGSGLYASISSGGPDQPTVTTKSGIVIGNTRITDTNGNYLSSSNPVIGRFDCWGGPAR